MCDVRYDVTSISGDLAENGSVLNVDADVTVNGCAMISKNVNLVTDAYSTGYEIKTTIKEINSSNVLSLINENVVLNETIEKFDFYKLCDIYASITDISHERVDAGFLFKAKLNVAILGQNEEEGVEILEKTIPVEFKLKKDTEKESVDLDVNLVITKIDHEVLNGSLEMKIYINIGGFVFCNEKFMTLSDLILDETKPKEKSNSALTLYYPEHGDSVWNIAKKFCTSPKAIIDANNLEDDVISNKTMLIVPIV